MVRFDAYAAFVDAVIEILSPAGLEGAREIVLADADFEGWPLDDPRLIGALIGFARQPGRRLRLLARRYDIVQRDCPRFVAWRRTWGHVIDARRHPDETSALPSLLLVDRRCALQIEDRETWRGQVRGDAAHVHRCGDSVDALLQRAEPAFAQTTLGL